MYNNTGWIEKYRHAHTVSDDFLNTSEYKNMVVAIVNLLQTCYSYI